MIAQTQATDRPFLRADLTHPINKDCVLWLPCTESAGSRAYDLMRANHMVLTDAPSWSGSELGQCLSFNGTSNYGTVTHNSSISFDVASGSTFSAWIYPNTVSGGLTFGATNPRYVLAKYASDITQINYGLRIFGGSIDLIYRNNSGTNYITKRSDSEVVQSLKWQHVAAVHRGSGIDLYLNGSKVPSSTIPGSDPVTTSSLQNSLDLIVGQAGTQFARYFDGKIKHARIWKRALSSGEIVNLYTHQQVGEMYGGRLFSAPVASTACRDRFFFFGPKQ